MSANAWMEVMANHRQSKVEKVENGYYTRYQLEEIWGLETTQTKIRLREMNKDGWIKTKKFRIISGNRPCPIPHYKIIKTK